MAGVAGGSHAVMLANMLGPTIPYPEYKRLLILYPSPICGLKFSVAHMLHWAGKKV